MSALDLVGNDITISVLAALVLAQGLKAWLESLDGGFRWSVLVRDGGMPSAHTAVVSALALSVYFSEGVTPLTIVTAVVAGLVVRDAVGFRRAAGEQATVLNRLIARDRIHHRQLKEFLGHTPSQVLAGATLGVLVASWVYIF